jgi:hypothetical protein
VRRSGAQDIEPEKTLISMQPVYQMPVYFFHKRDPVKSLHDRLLQLKARVTGRRRDEMHFDELEEITHFSEGRDVFHFQSPSPASLTGIHTGLKAAF